MKLGHPLLIVLYSFALLLLGCAVGSYWRPTPSKAIGFAIAGSFCTMIHDTMVSVVWFGIAAKWSRQTARAMETKLR